MTDKETLIVMLDKASLDYFESEDGTSVEVDDGDDDLYVSFEFDEDSTLTRVAAWET